jgi:cytochrome P450
MEAAASEPTAPRTLDPDEIDFFASGKVLADPYPYYEALRERCPVRDEPHHDVVMVTGYEEALAVFRDLDTFSSANSVSGPFPPFPVPLEGDDVTDLIEQHRHELPFSDQLPCLDPPEHTRQRGLMLRLLTPGRLRESEHSVWELADQQLDEFIQRGSCEYIAEFAAPYAMLVIADLLGVPEDDRRAFREQLAKGTGLGGGETNTMTHSPLAFLYEKFSAYVEDRRSRPRPDVLTRMAQATYPDGSPPEVIDVVRIAANLFAAGQETTVRLLGTALQLIAEREDLQQRLRSDHDAIPNFLEEVLRFDGPIKGDFRLARTATTIGGVDVPAGATVMVLNGAANRDPRKFERPDQFQPDRANAREHLAFGHGAHFCAGATLARLEARIAVQRILERTSSIRISEQHHGPPGERRYRYLPTYILRGLNRLHLEFDPVDGRKLHA